jgi:hypothetical protein
MKISYTDKVAPLQPDDTVAMFVVRGVKEIRRTDPSVDTAATDPALKKLKQKVPTLQVTLSLVVGEGEPYPFVDFIPILAGWIDKLDKLRIATGELIASREDFETDTLIDKKGYLMLTEKDGKNFIKRYLKPEEGEDAFAK